MEQNSEKRPVDRPKKDQQKGQPPALPIPKGKWMTAEEAVQWEQAIALSCQWDRWLRDAAMDGEQADGDDTRYYALRILGAMIEGRCMAIGDLCAGVHKIEIDALIDEIRGSSYALNRKRIAALRDLYQEVFPAEPDSQEEK